MLGRMTLGRFFAVGVLCLGAALATLLYVVSTASLRAATAAARKQANAVGEVVATRLDGALAAGPRAVRSLAAVIDAGDDRLRSALDAILAAETDLDEIAFFGAAIEGFAADGTPRFAAAGRTIVRAARRPTPPEADSERFSHPTITTPARSDQRGRLLWSDLAWSDQNDVDGGAARRIVVSVQSAIVDASGRFRGVARAAIDVARLERLTANAAGAELRASIVDQSGRVVARAAQGEATYRLFGDDLRVTGGEVADTLPSLVAERPLAAGIDWFVRVRAPEAIYLGDSRRMRRELLSWMSVATLVLVGGGLAAVRLIKRAIGDLVDESRRIAAFDFAPRASAASFSDVAAARSGLEGAKGALRSLSRYAPLPLVRRLFAAGMEPRLGGSATEVTMLFTDIENFTTIAEAARPDELAAMLGRYFEVLAAVIHEHGGVIDKFIGDSVMAFWNAPEPTADHAARAVRAAIACESALDELFRGADWASRPPLRTRFGIHTDRVLVGHFGAPDRLAYTLLGDGVNLASRLEGLNKTYGTTLLVSAAVVSHLDKNPDGGAPLSFRLVDDAVVKGRAARVQVLTIAG